jgi:hypothetical protein
MSSELDEHLLTCTVRIDKKKIITLLITVLSGIEFTDRKIDTLKHVHYHCLPQIFISFPCVSLKRKLSHQPSYPWTNDA